MGCRVRAARVLVAAGSALAAVGILPEAGGAQIFASEAATVSQTIDGTTITIDYSRPSLRGRDVHVDLFGDQIPWGRAWTPGANTATTIESTRNFVLSGAPVPAGKWSVWMVPGPEDWELVLDPRDDLYHTAHPKPTDDQIRVDIETRRAPDSAETLNWTFTTIRRDGADLRMQWGDIAVDLAIEVEPTMRVTMSPEEAAAYVGSWTVERLGSEYIDEGTFETDVQMVGDLLVGTFDFGNNIIEDVAFVPAAEQVFRLGFLINGELAEVMDWTFVEFQTDGEGQALSFDFRDSEDVLMMKGQRGR